MAEFVDNIVANRRLECVNAMPTTEQNFSVARVAIRNFAREVDLVRVVRAERHTGPLALLAPFFGLFTTPRALFRHNSSLVHNHVADSAKLGPAASH